MNFLVVATAKDTISAEKKDDSTLVIDLINSRLTDSIIDELQRQRVISKLI